MTPLIHTDPDVLIKRRERILAAFPKWGVEFQDTFDGKKTILIMTDDRWCLSPKAAFEKPAIPVDDKRAYSHPYSSVPQKRFYKINLATRQVESRGPRPLHTDYLRLIALVNDLTDAQSQESLLLIQHQNDCISALCDQIWQLSTSLDLHRAAIEHMNTRLHKLEALRAADLK
jgi:hypothetical protein